MNRAISAIFFLALGIANGQATNAVVAGGGFSPPPFLSTVPGELFTLFVAGLDPELSRPFFTQSPPLPFEINGLSAVISHADTFLGEPLPRRDYAVAIHSIRPAGALTAITFQVPLEIETRQLPSGNPAYLLGPINGAIRILHGDDVVANSDLMIWSSRIRVITSCDFSYQTNQNHDAPEAVSYCPPIIFRQDGRYTSHGVSPGEKIKVLVTGLGTSIQPEIRELLKSGWPNPDPPIAAGASYRQDTGTNLGARQPWASLPLKGPQPRPLLTLGTLLPNEYGIAALEFVVPRLNTPPNGGDPECPSAFATWRSNLTITIGTRFSYDTIQLCVDERAFGGPGSAHTTGRAK